MHVRPLADNDFFPWLGLWEGYSDFYASTLSDAKALLVWTWLMDPAHELSGFVADDDGRLVGLGHVREYVRTLDADRGLYLDDLFVAEEARNHGVGHALISHAKEIARARGLSVVTWITAAGNEGAQRLYDHVAERTEWVTYESPAVESPPVESVAADAREEPSRDPEGLRAEDDLDAADRVHADAPRGD